mmetsp:Transcript_28162/g.86047  ORF Transcript_28162/g.86047 Transcript_28162/m.86047 type:complete len:225 (+) Transcript_28162:340-1014(+)
MMLQASSELTMGCVSAGAVQPRGAGSAAAWVVPPVGCLSSGVRNDHGSCTDGSQIWCFRSCTRLPTPSTIARPRNEGAPPAAAPPSWAAPPAVSTSGTSSIAGLDWSLFAPESDTRNLSRVSCTNSTPSRGVPAASNCLSHSARSSRRRSSASRKRSGMPSCTPSRRSASASARATRAASTEARASAAVCSAAETTAPPSASAPFAPAPSPLPLLARARLRSSE